MHEASEANYLKVDALPLKWLEIPTASNHLRSDVIEDAGQFYVVYQFVELLYVLHDWHGIDLAHLKKTAEQLTEVKRTNAALHKLNEEAEADYNKKLFRWYITFSKLRKKPRPIYPIPHEPKAHLPRGLKVVPSSREVESAIAAMMEEGFVSLRVVGFGDARREYLLPTEGLLKFLRQFC